MRSDQGGEIGMNALINLVMGKTKQDLEAKATKDPSKYGAIYSALQYHSEEMFRTFKYAVKFKIARDNLSEQAVTHFAVQYDKSLPDIVPAYSFSRVALGLRDISSRGRNEGNNGYLALCSLIFNVDDILRKIPPSASSANKNDQPISPNNIHGSLEDYKRYQSYIKKLKAFSDEIVQPQYQKLRPQFQIRLQEWWQCGIPPPAYAMNSTKSISDWLNAEDAMEKMQRMAVANETKHFGHNEKAEDYKIDQKSLNSLASIIGGYIGTPSQFDDQLQMQQWWHNRNQILKKKPSSLDYVDLNYLTLYLSIMTKETLLDPQKRRSAGPYGTKERYDGQVEEKIKASIDGATQGNTLKPLYQEIVKNYFLSNEKANSFLPSVESNTATYSRLEERYYQWNMEWLPSHGFTSETADLIKFKPYKPTGFWGRFWNFFYNAGTTSYDVSQKQHRRPTPPVNALSLENPWKV
jgi:hypothetical protein